MDGTVETKYRLINPDSSGPTDAMPARAIRAVIINEIVEFAKNRSNVPAPIKSKDQLITRSSPQRPLILAANGEKIPIQSTGIVVSKLASEALMFNSFRIDSNIGEIELMDNLKLSAAKKTAAISKPPDTVLFISFTPIC